MHAQDHSHDGRILPLCQEEKQSGPHREGRPFNAQCTGRAALSSFSTSLFSLLLFLPTLLFLFPPSSLLSSLFSPFPSLSLPSLRLSSTRWRWPSWECRTRSGASNKLSSSSRQTGSYCRCSYREVLLPLSTRSALVIHHTNM